MGISSSELQYVRDLVYEQSGIVLDESKSYLVEARLTPIVKEEGFESIDALAQALSSKPFGPLHLRTVDAMTTNETSFFRDLHPFQALQNEVLPDLLEKRADTKSLNIWCAACSSGQEIYTILMVIKEHFPQLENWKLNVTATDLSPEMVDRARTGIYSQVEVNRGMPAPMLIKYFKKDGANWQVDEKLRNMVNFSELNLTKPWPNIHGVDVVFIRNVLIYFDVETKQGILARMRKSMKPDGYMFLGGAETTIGIDDAFERIPLANCGLYRIRSE